MVDLNPHGLLSSAEVANIFGCTYDRVGQWARAGLLRSTRIGGRHLFLRKDVADFEAELAKRRAARGVPHIVRFQGQGTNLNERRGEGVQRPYEQRERQRNKDAVTPVTFEELT
jgi:excisionase family DNA binding protein